MIQDIISQGGFAPEKDGVFVGSETRTGTVQGSCGGTAELTIESPEMGEVDFSGTMISSSFCERGIILNGSGDISGAIETPGMIDIKEINFSSANLSAIIEGVSYTIDSYLVN